MKLCPTCQHCYSDVDVLCVHDGHTALEPSRPGTRLIAGKYLLDWWLNGNATEALYAGTHVELDRSVAIRLIQPQGIADPQTLERFGHEVRATILLQHPNVAEMHDCGSLPQGEAYLVTEWVLGQTLDAYLRTPTPLPFPQVAQIAGQIAEGLEAAHQCGILHGGLRPSHILLTRERQGQPQVKIVGFGMATLREQMVSRRLPIPSSESLLPKLRYLSPEQLTGQGLDVRSDIYSFGVILYEMLTGWPPFDGRTVVEIRLKQIMEDPLPLKELRSDVPEALAQLVRETLHKNPSARPQSAAEVARRLRYFEEFTRPTVHVAAGSGPSFQPEGSPASEPSTILAPVSAEEDPVMAREEIYSSVAGDATTRRITILMVANAIAKMPWKGRRKTADDRAASSASAGKPAAAWRRLGSFSPTYVGLALALVLIGGALWMARSRTLSRSSDTSAVPNRLAQLMSLRGGRLSTPAIPGAPRPGAPERPPSAQPMPITQDAHTNPVRPTDSPAQNSPRPDDDEDSPKMKPRRPATTVPRPASSQGQHTSLQAALNDWLAATNARDMNRQKDFYMPTVSVFYRAHNISRSAVLNQKARLFGPEPSVGLRASDPKITWSRDGRKANMRFRKQFFIDGDRRRPMEVVQELSWLKTDAGWKITGEREVP